MYKIKKETMLWCQGCEAKENVYAISVSHNGIGWTTIHLCDKCIAGVGKKVTELMEGA